MLNFKFPSRLLKELVFPQICGVCLKNKSNPIGICKECQSNMLNIPPPNCVGCGGTLDGIIDLCQECLQNPRPWGKAYAVYTFKGLPREIILRLKYGGDILCARILGQIILAKWPCSTFFNQYDLIVPVPLHWFKKMRRGYNQSELIAREMSELYSIKYMNLLSRIKWTQSQTSLSRRQRRKNLKRAFQVKQKINLINKSILLIDDVLTTGSTLAACTNKLIAAGCDRVDVLTIARG